MAIRSLLERAAHHGADYLASLSNRPVQPTVSNAELRRALAGPLPQASCPAEQVLEELVAASEPGLLGSAGPRFFGWVIGGSVPAAVAADCMTSAWDQNAGAYACSPAAAVVEEVCGAWLKQLLGLPEAASFALVTGSQMAHVTALAAARYRLLARCGWDVGARGLHGAPPLRVLAGEHHETLVRAVRLLGLGTHAIERVGRDAQGRLDPRALQSRFEGGQPTPTLVCLQAGDIDTGTFDPFTEACEVAHVHGAWVHVDGAFGLWARASPSHAQLLRGVEQADSWATDGHKWLNVPYDCGYVFVADTQAHRASMTMDASYAIEGAGRDAFGWGPEWSRRARAFPTYAAIRSLGRHGIAELVERTSRLAVELVDGLAGLPGVEVVRRPIINQGLVRFIAEDGDHDRRTDVVIEAIRAEGTAWFGGTTFEGDRVMRISVCNWQTTAHDVQLTIDAVARVLRAG